MLNFPAATRIYVCSEPIDIRKGFDALAGWVEANGLDVYSVTHQRRREDTGRVGG